MANCPEISLLLLDVFICLDENGSNMARGILIILKLIGNCRDAKLSNFKSAWTCFALQDPTCQGRSQTLSKMSEVFITHLDRDAPNQRCGVIFRPSCRWQLDVIILCNMCRICTYIVFFPFRFWRVTIAGGPQNREIGLLELESQPQSRLNWPKQNWLNRKYDEPRAEALALAFEPKRFRIWSF